jgi:hypothetical protein
MKTSAEPVTLTLLSTPAEVIENELATITLMTNNTPSSEEKCFLRYTVDNWTNSEIATFNMTGNTGTATIPGQTSGITVRYYAFSSTVTSITADYDLYTIHLNNNGGANYSYTVTLPPDPEITWANLQYPETGNIEPGDSFDVYAQVYVEGITDQVGQGADVQAWIGYSTTDTDPSTWTNWVAATYNTDAGNNDEYLADLGAVLTTEGTYYYASRFQYLAQSYVYGGFDGGFWDGTTNTSGILTIATIPDPEITWANLQYPETGNIEPGDSFDVYAQVYVEGITDQVGQGADVQAWIGYSTSDTDPSTWTNWVAATYNTDQGNNDEYLADLGAAITSEGTYYYASRFQYLSQSYVYGGYSAGGGGFWDGTTYVSGVLTVANTVIYYPVLFSVTDATGLYSNIKLKGDMTNWEPVDMVQSGSVWSVSLEILPGTYEWGVMEDDGSPSGIWLIEGNNLVVNIDAGGGVTGDTTYVVTFVDVAEQSLKVNLYPNPTRDWISVDLTGTSSPCRMQLFDGFGNLMMESVSETINRKMDLSALPPGVYLLVIRAENQWLRRSIVKQ